MPYSARAHLLPSSHSNSLGRTEEWFRFLVFASEIILGRLDGQGKVGLGLCRFRWAFGKLRQLGWRPYFLFLTDFRCYCLACDAEIDCRFVEPVFEPVCWLVVPLIFAECGLIDRVGMKFIIVICRTKYLFWNPQIGSVRIHWGIASPRLMEQHHDFNLSKCLLIFGTVGANTHIRIHTQS